tara:strand:- start:977 stop:1405 length:429 start_codon:yes stop_codon:yes gene_type:complete
MNSLFFIYIFKLKTTMKGALRINFKNITRYLMSIFYISIGINHFTSPDWFVQIVPPYMSYKYELVYISGFFEIILGALLCFPRFKRITRWGLILLLIAVYPANIYLAQTNGAAMDTTPLVAWGRLPIQFIFIYLAFWHTKES